LRCNLITSGEISKASITGLEVTFSGGFINGGGGISDVLAGAVGCSGEHDITPDKIQKLKAIRITDIILINGMI